MIWCSIRGWYPIRINFRQKNLKYIDCLSNERSIDQKRVNDALLTRRDTIDQTSLIYLSHISHCRWGVCPAIECIAIHEGQPLALAWTAHWSPLQWVSYWVSELVSEWVSERESTIEDHKLSQVDGNLAKPNRQCVILALFTSPLFAHPSKLTLSFRYSLRAWLPDAPRRRDVTGYDVRCTTDPQQPKLNHFKHRLAVPRPIHYLLMERGRVSKRLEG